MYRHLAPPQLSACSTRAHDLSSSSEAFTQNEYPTSASKPRTRWTTTALVVFALLFAVTFASAALVAAIPPFKVHARETLLAIGLDVRPHHASLHALLVTRVFTNAVIALTPTEWALLGVGRSARWRPAVDGILAATLASDAILVGSAIGSFGLPLVPYLPHLPLEWGALACGIVPWSIARRRPLDRAAVLAPLAAVAVLLLLAGCVETWLTPHT